MKNLASRGRDYNNGALRVDTPSCRHSPLRLREALIILLYRSQTSLNGPLPPGRVYGHNIKAHRVVGSKRGMFRG